MPALRCWRCANCRDCANFGRPTMSPCRLASPRPRSCSHAWPELCLIPPTSMTTVLSPRGAGCSRPDLHASKTRRSAVRSACCWATILAKCAFSSTPRPTWSSRSIATTAWACGTSATTRPPPATPSILPSMRDVLRNRIRRLVRGVRVGRTIRLKRQLDGHDLNVDAMLDAGIALRIRQEPDPRIFRATTSKHRDLAVLLLLDISESTRDRLASGAAILEVERLAVAVLAEAMGRLGDPFSLLAFASDGREDVKMTSIKSFDEPYDRTCKSRLAGLTSGLSTRLGTALRHAGRVI